MKCKIRVLDGEAGEMEINSSPDGRSLTMTMTMLGARRSNTLEYVDSQTQPDPGKVTIRDVDLEWLMGLQVSSSENNLKQLGLICKMFANESAGGVYPPLSKKAGCLMFSKEAVYPEYFSDPGVMKSPMNENAKNVSPGDSIDDNSYIYFGYLFTTPGDVDVFLNMYKASLRGECSLDQDLVETTSGKRIRRLKEGIERFLITDVNDPAASSKAQAAIPVLMERRAFYKDGKAPVLFMDGKVKRVARGENAVIDRIFELLPKFEALDGQGK
jgi:hypothetical protein